jgi:hypothetical protein
VTEVKLQETTRHGTAIGSRVESSARSLGLLVLGLLLVGVGSADAFQEHRAPESEPATIRFDVGTKVPPYMRTGLTPVLGEIRSGAFALGFRSRVALMDLWDESTSVGEERVACLGGYLEDGVFHITKAAAVPTEKADSLRVSPRPSLERCGPPDWQGTVHTHIALFKGHPFATLSPSDRHVNGMWRLKWGTEGIFCVLYSDSEGYCEYGPALNGDFIYSESGSQTEGSPRPRL